MIEARKERVHELIRSLKSAKVRSQALGVDATGCLNEVRMHKISYDPEHAMGVDFAEIPGYLEVSAHGIIGMGWVPDKSGDADDLWAPLGGRPVNTSRSPSQKFRRPS